MNNSLYNGMLSGLSKVNLGGFERSQAELHMQRAAALVEMVMGSREVAVQPAAVEAPVVQREEYRAAA